jgi:hypothetical protein
VQSMDTNSAGPGKRKLLGYGFVSPLERRIYISRWKVGGLTYE